MRTIKFHIFLSAFLLVTTNLWSQSIRLDNEHIHRQQLILGKQSVNLDFSDFTTVVVAGNCDYTVVSEADWLSAQKMSNGNTVLFGQPNYNLSPRTGFVVFTSSDSSVVRRLPVEQAGQSITDQQIVISSASASASQSGEGIERTYDGNYSTLYHSPYGGTNFPVTLTYNFADGPHIDYALYTPRQDGNNNGNFGRVRVEYLPVGATEWVTLSTVDLGGSASTSRIPLGEDGIDNVQSVRFVVLSGANDFASCAEMEFYDSDTYMEDILRTYFADNLCTQLKEGISDEEISQIPVAEVREVAEQMQAGTYSTDYRLSEYDPYRPIWDLQSELKNSYAYNNHENPTGITFGSGETVIILAEGIGDQQVSLQIRNFGPDVFAASTYSLHDGVNMITTSNKGNGYINYYTYSWKTAPKVKIHFMNATEQGYFSPKYRGHTNADWKALLANAKGDCLDMHGEFCDCVFPVSAFKANCPDDGMWLMAAYDSIVSIERELMGVFKYNHEFPNHQCAITVATSGGLYHASNDGFCVPVNALRDPTSKTYYDFWGSGHELGHQNQTQGLRWIGLTEVTNNIMSAYVQHKLQSNGYHRLENESNGFRYYDYFEKNIMAGGQFIPHANNDVFCTLIPFWQLLVYTRIAGVQPDAYPELYETLRKNTALDSMTDGEQQVNFMRTWCHITKTNYLPFFKQVGMFKTVNESISDYSTRNLTITQTMLDALEREIESAGYAEAPAAFCYIDANNYEVFRDKALLESNEVGAGCSLSGNNIRIQHSQWKNVVGFETYKADGTLLHMTNYGHGDNAIHPSTTTVVWDTSEEPAYIMAVGYDGTRVKCWE